MTKLVGYSATHAAVGITWLALVLRQRLPMLWKPMSAHRVKRQAKDAAFLQQLAKTETTDE